MSISEKNLKEMGYAMKNGVLVKEGTPKQMTPSISQKGVKKSPEEKASREKQSIGKHFVNFGKPTSIKEGRFVLNKSRRYFLFDAIPIQAPRLTALDRVRTNPNHVNPKKRKRQVVITYQQAKSNLINQANKMNYKMGRTLEVIIFMPMPDNWKKSIKEDMNGMPCLSVNINNLLAFFIDSLKKNNYDVWSINAKKYWAYKGSILVYQ